MGTTVVKGGKVVSLRPASAKALEEGAITEDYLDKGLDAIPTVDDDELDDAVVLDGRITDLKEEGAKVQGRFYVRKGGFGRNGETIVTIVFPRQDRDTALALIDMENRMLDGTFEVKRQTRRVSTEEEMAAWMEANHGTGNKGGKGT